LLIADGERKELPRHFFNRQSAISNQQSAMLRAGAARYIVPFA
jgi:hypothetical protein